MAFLVPVDINCWPFTAIDKFRTYGFEQYERLSITIPNEVNSSTRSTAVILWGSGDRIASADDNDGLEAEFNVWRNINLKMIFQGLARTNVHIKHFDPEQTVSMFNGEQQMVMANENYTNRVHHAQGGGKEKPNKIGKRWLPAPICRNKEFTGE